MGKKLLLTSGSIVAFSIAIYADSGVIAEREADVGINSSPIMRALNDKKVDFPSQKLSQYPAPTNLPKSTLTDSFVFINPETAADNLAKKTLTDSVVVIERETQADESKTKMSDMTQSPQLAGFTIDDTVKLARLAQLAYIDTGKPEDAKFKTVERLQAEGGRVQFFGTEAENSGLIITNKDGSINIIYKGTNSIRNLATDVWFTMAIDNKTGLRCHNGIMEGFYRTQEQVFSILKQIAETRKKSLADLLRDDVTVTGHSLGGGLSEMFMGYAFKIHKVAVKAITFAAPRVFDVATSEELDGVFHDKYLNVMQVTDPVPGIALGSMGYKHFGTKLHLPYQKSEWQHKMGGYLAALEAIAQSPVKVGSTTYTFEESERTGLGNAKWIGDSMIPNPLYPIHAAREVIARNVDPVVHKAVKSVKDTAVNTINSIGETAKKVWNYFRK